MSKTVTVTFHNVREVVDDPTVVFITMAGGWSLVLPKTAVKGMEMTISDEPNETRKDENASTSV